MDTILKLLAFLVLGLLIGKVIRYSRARYGVWRWGRQFKSDLVRRFDSVLAKEKARENEPMEVVELLTEAFMRKHTKWVSVFELEREAGFRFSDMNDREMTDDEEARLDAAIQGGSRFSGFPEMLRIAMSFRFFEQVKAEKGESD